MWSTSPLIKGNRYLFINKYGPQIRLYKKSQSKKMKLRSQKIVAKDYFQERNNSIYKLKSQNVNFAQSGRKLIY